MLSSLLTERTIQIQRAHHLDWREAIKEAAKPLLDTGKIEKSYVQTMISLVEKNGPYINIGPYIALAHARPENGVNEMGMSLMKVEPAVNLVNADHPIKLFFVLAAVDNTKHLQALRELLTLLEDSNNVQKLENAASVAEMAEQFKEEAQK
ncbi:MULTISPECIES: PTS sugar transporter subunit IIA [unclassified Sporolactobacillus]|uniref:PTS sugar transporter subunit IIA n=1 Tax=unclassified Sporolactobacillus TaxID=2628533 RepID=UPI002367A417|nr:PTS sugar transporter subunit IIA [Sporolactobacillus sp. CQH2019]MDD9149955.1 PTS sugar transporter subunit IIA [Sporolactobacillus sp. CQH2019]